MAQSPPTLHMFCGKMAAGKSTLAARLSEAPSTVLLVEDTWLSTLFAEHITTPKDFFACANKLREMVGPHVTALLTIGNSVVLDFAANTVASRSWMRDILAGTDAAHQMHVLTPPDRVCLARLHARNAGGQHPFAPTEDHFHQFSKHFVVPTPEEGFNLVMHGHDDPI